MVTTLLLVLLLGPLAVAACTQGPGRATHWSQTRWDSAGALPPARDLKEALVRVYAARTWGWKGIFAVHAWLVIKPPGGAEYERYEVVGWGVRQGRPAVRRNMRPPDGFWAGNPPELIAELRGAEAEAVLPRIEQAILAYPHRNTYWTWPGPNSNSFVAAVMRDVPELGRALPPTAIGKGLPAERLADRSCSVRHGLPGVAARPAGRDAGRRGGARGQRAGAGAVHRPQASRD